MKYLLLALGLAVPLWAQSTGGAGTPLPLGVQDPGDFALDLHVEIPPFGFVPVDGSPRWAALGSHLYITINLRQPADAPESVVEIDVPGGAQEVYPPEVCSNTKPVRCTIPASHWNTSIFVTTTLNEAGHHNVTARVIAPGDPNPANDQHTVPLEIVDAPSLEVTTMPSFWPLRTHPSQEQRFSASVSNYDGQDARNVVLTLTLPDGGTFTGGLEATTPAELNCSVDPASVVCTLPFLPNKGGIGVIAATKAPDRLTGGDFTFKATVTSDRPDFHQQDNTVAPPVPLIRHLLVTNTGDEGAGSLRQALLDAQQFCATAPCTVDFRIPGTPQDGRFVIQPRSELPELRGTVNLDGSTQKAFGGDLNPTGPEIELDGSLMQSGSRGVVLGNGCDMHVRDLLVRNFPGPAIELPAGRTGYEGCEPGFAWPAVTVTQNHLIENYRGVAFNGAPAASVTDNVILSNRRAGLFIQNGAYTWVERNLIGGNAASGVFLDAILGVVAGNHILANGEWGLARTKRGDIAIQRNSIHDNGYLAIDAGLDFQTPNRQPDTADEPPNVPVLFSAHYDPTTNKIVIRGRLDSTSLDERTAFTIDLYASRAESGEGQAEQWIAQQAVTNNADFTIDADGDHRGKRITATHTRARRIYWDDTGYNTSELSSGVTVQ